MVKGAKHHRDGGLCLKAGFADYKNCLLFFFKKEDDEMTDYEALCKAVVSIAAQSNSSIRTMDLGEFEKSKDRRIKVLVDTYLATNQKEGKK